MLVRERAGERRRPWRFGPTALCDLWLSRWGAERQDSGAGRELTPISIALLRPALLGLLASVAVTVGASRPSSPFALNCPGAWYFGSPHAGTSCPLGGPPSAGGATFFSMLAVYGGILLMLRAWFDLLRVVRSRPGTPVRALVPVFVLWILPLLVVPPLFSSDVYSYVAQGEMWSHGINPYSIGPNRQFLGDSSFYTFVSPIWKNVTSPYGPLFLGLSSLILKVTGHNELLSVDGFRLLALGGTVLTGVFIPRLARSYGFDGALAFSLAALNPLVLLYLVGGAHNDALMIGLLVAGLTLARSGRPVLGIVLCALAASVKVPALLGVVYIGWEWLGDEVPRRARLAQLVTALLIAGVTMTAVSEIGGLGWGWVRSLGTPGSVRSWIDPATALGVAVGHLAETAGLGDHVSLAVGAVRLIGIVAAAAVVLALLYRSTRRTSALAIAFSFFAVVLLGPVIQPWYVAWGLVMLAVAAQGRLIGAVCVGTFVAAFFPPPGGTVFVNDLNAASPAFLTATGLTLLAVIVLVFAPGAWLRRAERHEELAGARL